MRRTVAMREIDRLGAVVDALADAGGNVFGPEFSGSDPTQPQMQATRAAIDDARRRAEDAAARIGHRITGIRSIDLDPSFGAIVESGSDDAAGGEVRTRIEPGREEIAAIVRVVYAIAPA